MFGKSKLEKRLDKLEEIVKKQKNLITQLSLDIIKAQKSMEVYDKEEIKKLSSAG